VGDLLMTYFTRPRWMKNQSKPNIKAEGSRPYVAALKSSGEVQGTPRPKGVTTSTKPKFGLRTSGGNGERRNSKNAPIKRD